MKPRLDFRRWKKVASEDIGDWEEDHEQND
jgi:hypothetical protein